MPVATSNANPNRVEAGAALRRIRTEREWVLQDVENETLRRFGESGVIRKAQLSRIEKGQFDRISLDDACHLAQVYGMSPDEMGALYGVWPKDIEDRRPSEIQEADVLARSLPNDVREDFLSWVSFASMQARAKARERMREQSPNYERVEVPLEGSPQETGARRSHEPRSTRSTRLP